VPYFEQLQLCSADIANPTLDFLTFANSAHWFGLLRLVRDQEAEERRTLLEGDHMDEAEDTAKVSVLSLHVLRLSRYRNRGSLCVDQYNQAERIARSAAAIEEYYRSLRGHTTTGPLSVTQREGTPSQFETASSGAAVDRQQAGANPSHNSPGISNRQVQRRAPIPTTRNTTSSVTASRCNTVSKKAFGKLARNVLIREGQPLQFAGNDRTATTAMTNAALIQGTSNDPGHNSEEPWPAWDPVPAVSSARNVKPAGEVQLLPSNSSSSRSPPTEVRATRTSSEISSVGPIPSPTVMYGQ